MDTHNYFDTKTTNRLIRAEWAVLLLASAAVLIIKFSEVNWTLAIVAFLYIDLIGTAPGVVAASRSKNGKPHRIYYILYNLMHSVVTQSMIIIAWTFLFGWNYGLMAIPLHLAADRALFGNFLKTFGSPFDGSRIEPFDRFIKDFSEYRRNTTAERSAVS